MTQRKMIAHIFDYFYNRIYKTTFKLDESVNNQGKLIDNFLKLLSVYYPGTEGLGSSFFIQYFSWCFAQRVSQITQRKISLNWIIGKKMFNNFVNRNTDGDYYVDNFLREYDIIIDDLKSELHEEELINNKLDPAEENEKLRFYGEARLFNCLINTTLYNHRSVNCISCEMKKECKTLLQKKFPKTYKKRGYEG